MPITDSLSNARPAFMKWARDVAISTRPHSYYQRRDFTMCWISYYLQYKGVKKVPCISGIVGNRLAIPQDRLGLVLRFATCRCCSLSCSYWFTTTSQAKSSGVDCASKLYDICSVWHKPFSQHSAFSVYDGGKVYSNIVGCVRAGGPFTTGHF